jgi:hypothetical protein
VNAEERASFREAVGPGLADLAREIAAERDVGVRELEASASFARLLAELDEVLVGDALDIVADAPGGVAALSSLRVGGDTELAVRATVRLEERGDLPVVPLLTVAEAWRLTEEGAPVESISALCHREGEQGAQLFTFVLDHEASEGAVKLGFASGLGEGRRVASALVGGDHHGAALAPVEPAAAHAAIVDAALAGARGGWRPDDDGLLSLRVYLRASRTADADAIIQAIELGESLPERIDAIDELAAREAADLLVADARAWFEKEGFELARREWGVKALELMLECSFAVGVEIDAWREEELDDFLLAWVPESVTMDDEAVGRFPSGVSDAVRYLVAADLLEPSAGAALERTVGLLRDEFEEAMNESPESGPAQALVAAMRAEGVDVGDAAAVESWITAFNERSWEERDAVLGPALDPVAPGIEAPGRARGASKKRAARKAQRKARRRNRG